MRGRRMSDEEADYEYDRRKDEEMASATNLKKALTYLLDMNDRDIFALMKACAARIPKDD